MRYFTNSELSTFKECRRRWWLSYYRRLALQREDSVSAAQLGTLVHLGLEHYYRAADANQPDDALAAVQARIDVDREAFAENPSKLKEIEKQAKLANAMLEGYFAWLEESGADSDLDVIGPEVREEVEILPGVSLLVKLDLKMRRRSDGSRLFLDTKTSQSIDTVMEGAYRSSQFRTYGLVEYLRFLEDQKAGTTTDGERCDGVIVNVLRKVGRTATAKPPFYGREEFRWNDDLLRNHWRQVVGEIQRVLEVEVALESGGDPHSLVPPSPSRDCSWKCQFKAVCPMFDDGSDVESVLTFSYVEKDPLDRYESDDPDTN